MEYLKAITHPPNISLEWPVTRQHSQENELCKEEMRTITLKNGTLIQYLGSEQELYTFNR